MNTKTTFIALLPIVSFLIFSLPSMGRADNAGIKDPHNFLNQVDVFLGTPEFSTSFRLGDRITFEFGEKSVGSNQAVYKAEVVLEPKSQNLIVQQTSADGKVFSKDKIQPEIWKQMNGNYLRVKINQLVSYGLSVEIQDLKRESCPPLSDLSTLRLQSDCLKVELIAIQSIMGLTSHYTFILQNNPEGLAQIVYYRQQDKGFANRELEFRLINKSYRKYEP